MTPRREREAHADAGGTSADRTPLVSVVIPCFNAGRYVAAAIESALAQTHPRIEVIVIDDASSDGTPRVLDAFEGRIVQVRMEATAGPAACRNRGLDVATGEFVQFLDADDLLLPEKVEVCLREFDDDTDIVFAENAYFRDGEKEPRLTARERLVRWAQSRPMRWDPTRAAEYVLRREVQTAMPLHRTDSLRRAGGFRPGLWSLEETELHFRLALAGARMAKVERVLVHCRHHGSPGRLRLRPGRYLVSLQALDAMRLGLNSARRVPPGVEQALADRYAKVGRELLWEGRVAQARSALETAMLLSPRPRPSRVPLYNLLARVLGLRRLEVLRRRLSGRGAPDPAVLEEAPPAGGPLEVGSNPRRSDHAR